MPELPEVNTLVTALSRRLRGDSIIAWQRRSPKLRGPIPDSTEAGVLTDRKIVDIRRIAKSIYFDFGCSQLLKVHLGMTGYFLLTSESCPEAKHAHLMLRLASGQMLTFCDSRRFGSIEITSWPDKVVVEPFKSKLTATYLATACNSRQCSIKALIMDQHIIAGLGNIYASEALFKAGIRPDRSAGSLKPTEIKKLCSACIAVIDAAIKAGNASFGDKPEIDRGTTHFAIETCVYDQQNQICQKCQKSKIAMVRISGRSSCFCPTCQK
ncbi:MAG: bifunctional DNA-formamidopyrimidine glycosylase/DNA-(apurinic or apyrimidinic site) lyase [Candidatus Riflebacteria bacterium]|nr:bifunctional DNA-formamidopyrimidine glycosylase/DNA-(apurinic or apyrimidinic site) lyase [Candidatus Riflebacteria bacterium]